MVRREEGLVEVLVVAAAGGVAAAAAVAAALEAAEACAAARQAAEGAADDAPEDAEDDETADDDDGNDGPPAEEFGSATTWTRVEDGQRVLAERSLHAIVPAGKGRLDVGDGPLRIANHVSPRQAAGHCDVQGIPGPGPQ